MSGSDLIKARADALGHIGQFLSAHLGDEDVDLMYGQQIARQVGYIELKLKQEGEIGKGIAEIKACSRSMLLAEFPVQCVHSEDIVKALVSNAFEKIYEIAGNKLDLSREKEDNPYPVKPHPAAKNKTNLFFSDAIEMLAENYPALLSRFVELSGNVAGMANDMVTAICMHAAALNGAVDDPMLIAMSGLLQPENAKGLSICLKSLGLNSTRTGSLLTEQTVLVGRGVGKIDMKSMVELRCSSRIIDSLPTFNHDKLRKCVRSIIESELDASRVEYEDLSHFWDRRWEWCVNGSHSGNLSRHVTSLAFEAPTKRLHRRVALENWENEPISGWKGDTYVTASEKIEHGKVRLLLACDTRNYVAFEHILKPVENQWLNSRTILDPGAMGYSGMIDRVRDIKSSYYAMFDYDDFNSQHSLLAQKMVFEELCDYTSYPKVLADSLVASFDRMLINVGGDDIGYAKATLMSGHRATTFLNSVLNSAYLKYSSNELWDSFKSMHVGDDIVSSFSSLTDLQEVITGTKSAGLRMNPLKQSVGSFTAEFLRVAIRPDIAVGYACRSIASGIGGSWVSEDPLAPEEALNALITNARSLVNRTGNPLLAEFYFRPLVKRIRIKHRTAKAILRGEESINYAPCYRPDCRTVTNIIVFNTKKKKDMINKKLEKVGVKGKMATTTYLSKAVTPVERSALVFAGSDIKEIMLTASYAKTLAEIDSDLLAETGTVIDRQSRPCFGLVSQDEIKETKHKGKISGRLTRYPLLSLMKGRLSATACRLLLAELGFNVTVGEALKVAWGEELDGLCINNFFPWSEACELGKIIGNTLLYVDRPIMV